MVEKMLSVKNLTAFYGNRKILDDVSISVASGELVCLCGRNGTGKSTLLSVLCGLSDSSLRIEQREGVLKAGIAMVDGMPVRKMSRADCARKIAYLGQSEFSVWDFSVCDFVLQGRFAYSKNGYYSEDDRQIAKECLNRLGLSALADRSVHNVSGGEFQKARIARALAQKAGYLVLDEPAAGLDFVYEPEMVKFLKELCKSDEGKIDEACGVLLSIHDVNVALRYADKIALLGEDGKLVCGTCDEIADENVLSNAFGKKIKVYNHSEYGCKQILS